jgi:hypothetical protein
MQTTLPVILWLAAAFLSFLGSVACWFFVDKQTGIYIGLWVPSILSLGGLLNSLPRRQMAEARVRPGTEHRRPQEAR